MRYKKTKNLLCLNLGLALLVIMIGFPKVNRAQDDVIRVNTELVTVPVSVMDRPGRYIIDLKKENFRLFEDEIEQEVAIFDSVEQPFSILLLVDVSEPMKDQMKNLSAAVDSFVRQLNPEDTLRVATFASDSNYLFKSTKIKDLQEPIKLKRHPYGYEETRLHVAVDTALKKTRLIEGRKAIVLFTDGLGDRSEWEQRNYDKAIENEAIIYTVQFDTVSQLISEEARKGLFRSEATRKRRENDVAQANNYMQTLADLTGGRRFQVADVLNLENLEKTFAEVANELRRQYSLGYYPKETDKKGELRKIKVQVNVPNVTVKLRKSYFLNSTNTTRRK
jgi:VWFA-related protein